MGAKTKSMAFTLVLDQGQARVRRGFAPAARPMEDRRRKQSRRRPDLLADSPAAGRDED